LDPIFKYPSRNSHSKSIIRNHRILLSVVEMTARAPRSVQYRLQFKGITRISDGIDLITSTERRNLQKEVEDLNKEKEGKDAKAKNGITVEVSKLRTKMQTLKVTEELAVLMFDKKDNAEGERVINFYKQEQALGKQQYLDGDEFESDTSIQLKKYATLDLKVKISNLAPPQPSGRKVKGKKQKVEDGTTGNGTPLSEKDKKRLARLKSELKVTHQKYLVELKKIKVGLCENGLKRDSPEACQLFKSFQEDANILITVTQYERMRTAKTVEANKKSVQDTIGALYNAVNDNPNACTIVPSEVNPAELARISENCRSAVEQANDVDDTDEDVLAKIQRIAKQHVMQSFQVVVD
jgi:hypothetical protein